MIIGQVLQFLECPINTEAAEGDEYQVRVQFPDPFPPCHNRVGTRLRPQVVAPGGFDQLRNPMAGQVKRLSPARGTRWSNRYRVFLFLPGHFLGMCH